MTLRTLEDAERYLDGLINRERHTQYDYERMGLARIRALLEAIGDPQRGMPCIHVAGSNGKGSVSHAAETLLRASGRRTGLFTSPHLETWRERFRLDGEPVSTEMLLAVLRRIQPAIESLRADADLCPSFFDVSTALALAIFREHDVDCAVIEVGLGGRLDSTNVVESSVCVLTSVQLEHTDKLGDTLELIATEKAGIAKPGVPFIHGPLHPEAWGALASRAIASEAPLEEARARDVKPTPQGIRFLLEDERAVNSAVLGEHQAHNLALAIRAVEKFLGGPLAPPAFEALRRLRIPARVERIDPDTILDVAHTPDAAFALHRALDAAEPGRTRVLVISISRDKDAAGIFAALASGTRACVLTRAEPDRSFDPKDLEPLAWAAGIEACDVVEEPRAALARARERAEPGDLLLIAGSVYLAGVLRGDLLQAARDR